MNMKTHLRKAQRAVETGSYWPLLTRAIPYWTLSRQFHHRRCHPAASGRKFIGIELNNEYVKMGSEDLSVTSHYSENELAKVKKNLKPVKKQRNVGMTRYLQK